MQWLVDCKILSVLASSKLPCHVEGFLCILLRISVQYFEVCYLPNKACLKIEQLVKSTKYIAIISFLCNMKYKINKSIIKEQHKLICHTNLFFAICIYYELGYEKCSS